MKQKVLTGIDKGPFIPEVRFSDRAFTIIELVVVLVIITVLSLIGVPLYKGYVNDAMISEGRALVNSIAKAENMHYMEYSSYYSTFGINPVTNDNIIAINAAMNRYFRQFRVTTSNGGQTFVATAYGTDRASGIEVSLDSDPDNNGQTDTGASITHIVP